MSESALGRSDLVVMIPAAYGMGCRRFNAPGDSKIVGSAYHLGLYDVVHDGLFCGLAVSLFVLLKLVFIYIIHSCSFYGTTCSD